MIEDDETASAVRLDVWLDVACLFRTRSEAQKACHGGKVDVNGQAAKPHRLLRVGDELRITRPAGRRQLILVRSLANRHLAKSAARLLYDDRTPLPSAEEIEARRLERLFRTSMRVGPSRAPTRRERRQLLRLKGR